MAIGASARCGSRRPSAAWPASPPASRCRRRAGPRRRRSSRCAPGRRGAGHAAMENRESASSCARSRRGMRRSRPESTICSSGIRSATPRRGFEEDRAQALDLAQPRTRQHREHRRVRVECQLRARGARGRDPAASRRRADGRRSAHRRRVARRSAAPSGTGTARGRRCGRSSPRASRARPRPTD